MPSKPANSFPVNPLVLGTWFALIAGLGDAFLFFVTSVLLARYNYLYPDLVWISPVSNIILFALPGVILWALARWRPAPYWRLSAMLRALVPMRTQR